MLNLKMNAPMHTTSDKTELETVFQVCTSEKSNLTHMNTSNKCAAGGL